MKRVFRNALCLLAITPCVAFFSCASEKKFNSKDFQADASFDLVVTASQYLPPGTTRIESQSAFVSLAHGLMPGNADGLEIVFLTAPITEASLPDIMNNDAGKLKGTSYAALVLYLDNEKRVTQANLSYVVPGSTVARTVAWKPDELARYFSDVKYDGARLVLRTNGTYSETESNDAMELTWNVDLDLPVIREVTR